MHKKKQTNSFTNSLCNVFSTLTLIFDKKFAKLYWPKLLLLAKPFFLSDWRIVSSMPCECNKPKRITCALHFIVAAFLFQDIVVGAACAEMRHQLDISYPVNNGIVQNWDDMSHVWDHAFYSELKVQITDYF